MFVLPMIVHIMAQTQLNEGEGPIAVIVAPTRGLAEQIHRQARIFGKPYGELCKLAFKFEVFEFDFWLTVVMPQVGSCK